MSSHQVSYFDFAINEQCWEFNECGAYAPFFKAAKPVFNIEYSHFSNATFMGKICPRAIALGIRSMKEHLLLDSWRLPCKNA